MSQQICLWAKSLLINDALDVYDSKERKWKVGIVIMVKKGNTTLKLLVMYNKSNKKEYDEWITLKLKKKAHIKSKIDKLHTHTKLSKSYKNKTNMCRDYIILGEMEIITNIITNTNIIIKTYDDIISLISEYAIGYIITCSHTQCNNQIIIDNQYDFMMNETFYYRIEQHKCPEKTKKLAQLYGQFYRVSCSICASKSLKNCLKSNCRNQDIEYDICLNHNEHFFCTMLSEYKRCRACKWNIQRNRISINDNKKQCQLCNEIIEDKFQLSHCDRCDIRVCKECYHLSDLKLCYLCYTAQEIDDIANAIDNSISIYLDLNVLDTIATFAVGVSVSCMNPNCSLRYEICTKSEFDFLCRKRDYDGRKISHYVVTERRVYERLYDHMVEIYGEMVEIYGVKRRIFCADCTSSFVKKCNACVNEDILRNMFCVNHLKCVKCNIYGYPGWELKACIKCVELCCEYCYDENMCKTCMKKEKQRIESVSEKERSVKSKVNFDEMNVNQMGIDNYVNQIWSRLYSNKTTDQK
eukprot:531270_1